jgi:hypothetical protein
MTMLLIVNELNLPLDVIGIIARFLVDDDAYGTCAALNMTSSLLELETTPIRRRPSYNGVQEMLKRYPNRCGPAIRRKWISAKKKWNSDSCSSSSLDIATVRTTWPILPELSMCYDDLVWQ